MQSLVLNLSNNPTEITKMTQRNRHAASLNNGSSNAHPKLSNAKEFASLEHGINDFAMVHDSYGAHAGHADTLNVLLREAFVAMYREDVLGKFREQLIAQLSPRLAAKIPPLPQFGSQLGQQRPHLHEPVVALPVVVGQQTPLGPPAPGGCRQAPPQAGVS